ncbi:MAG: Uma2 family endonuclease [Microcystis aeruginosa BS13-10]|nr:Uma2 family endonuclease [Microcystis aeruginosa BS13-10]
MMTVVEIKFESWQLSDEQFFQLCQDNRDLRLERNPKGDLIIMPPTGGKTGNSNGRITQQLFNWSDNNGTGIAFDSSTGFKLPNGADRSPDAAWIPLEKWQALTPQQKERFLPLSPDFVIERQGQAVEILTNPESLSGENILPEFSLNLTLIW